LERGSLDLRSERPKRSLWQKIVDLALTDARTLDGGFDEVSVEELERTLLESDFGVEVTMELVAELERAAERGRAGSESDLRSLLGGRIQSMLERNGSDAVELARPATGPGIALILGVNGTGKTTTAGKLAWRFVQQGEKVLLAATDTFRAGAQEQLRQWAERVGADYVGGHEGGDPAAVAFDAVEAALGRGVDRLLVDTAGRLHTQRNLMEELKKIDRVIGRLHSAKRWTSPDWSSRSSTARPEPARSSPWRGSLPCRYGTSAPGSGRRTSSSSGPTATWRRSSPSGRRASVEPNTILYRPVQYLKGVGPRRAETLTRLGIRSAFDLLLHLPHRYEDATTVASISSLAPGDEATIIGRVVSKGVIRTRRSLRVFHVVLRDDTGQVECAWPGRPWLDRSIRRGQLLLATGPVRFYHGRQMQPREHTVLAEEDELEGETGSSGRVFPVYPATEGLSHRQIRAIIQANLSRLLRDASGREAFDPRWRSEIGVPGLRDALATLHGPSSLSEVEPARRRLAYEELFYLQLLHSRARHRQRLSQKGIRFSGDRTLTETFLAGLPFRLTAAQQRAWGEIEADMEQEPRMYRLLQGDVGSGKTVIAALAMLKAAENGRQAALMAPTELLAEQHYRTLSELMNSVGIQPCIAAKRPWWWARTHLSRMRCASVRRVSW
jgi:adenylate kinase family enzyme